MNNCEKAQLVFAEELAYIKSDSVRGYVLECFKELTPDYFWDGPASSSGRFHPDVANKEHGLVLHTKLCVWWGRKLAETYNCEKDMDYRFLRFLLRNNNRGFYFVYYGLDSMRELY